MSLIKIACSKLPLLKNSACVSIRLKPLLSTFHSPFSNRSIMTSTKLTRNFEKNPFVSKIIKTTEINSYSHYPSAITSFFSSSSVSSSVSYSSTSSSSSSQLSATYTHSKQLDTNHNESTFKDIENSTAKKQQQQIQQMQEKFKLLQKQQQVQQPEQAQAQAQAQQEKQQEQQLTLGEKAKKLFKKYGVIAIAFHTGVYLVTLAGFYAAISAGVDVPKLWDSLHLNSIMDSSKLHPATGGFAVAYVVTGITGPLRTVLTITATPVFAKWLVRNFPNLVPQRILVQLLNKKH